MLILWCLLSILPETTAYTCISPAMSSKEANPLNCSDFFLCKNKEPDAQHCGDSETFDVDYRYCRPIETVESCSFAPTDCYINQGSAFDYQGTQNVAESGDSCIEWSKSIYSFNKYKLTSNYCRNPEPGRYSTPWCHTNSVDNSIQKCSVPKCTASSVKFDGESVITFNTGVGGVNSTYDLDASYEEQILLYIRSVDTEKVSHLVTMTSMSDDQGFTLKLFKKVITVYAKLEAGGGIAKANAWINLADDKFHKIVIRRTGDRIFLQVDDGNEHSSQLSGLTDKFILPMKVEIGDNFLGCMSSLDVVTKNADQVYRHHEPFEKLLDRKVSNGAQMLVDTSNFNGNTSNGCMLTPRFSETMTNAIEPTIAPTDEPSNGTMAEVESKNSKELFLILACVIGAALVILLVVLVIVCRSRNKDKGVYKLKETKQFDWEYGNLPPKNRVSGESEHGV